VGQRSMAGALAPTKQNASDARDTTTGCGRASPSGRNPLTARECLDAEADATTCLLGETVLVGRDIEVIAPDLDLAGFEFENARAGKVDGLVAGRRPVEALREDDAP